MGVALALGAGMGLVVLLRWPWEKVATALVVAAVKDPRVTPLLDTVPVGGHVLLVRPPILAPTPDQTDFIN